MDEILYCIVSNRYAFTAIKCTRWQSVEQINSTNLRATLAARSPMRWMFGVELVTDGRKPPSLALMSIIGQAKFPVAICAHLFIRLPSYGDI